MSTRSKFARNRLGRIGIWSGAPRFAGVEQGVAATQQIEALGFPALWMPGGIDGGVLADLDRLLDATHRIVLATGIINVWRNAPEEVAAWWKGQSEERRARLFFGVGVSHGPAIGDDYDKTSPLAKMRSYVDGLEAAGMPLDRICLAALGPKMLELAGKRTAGAHPYLVTADHTAKARAILGPDALLAPELGVVFESDQERATAIVRQEVTRYTQLPNYVNNWRRDGFTDEEITGFAPRFVDAITAWGDLERISTKIEEHFAAGADHVCLQVLSSGGMTDVAGQKAVWGELAKLLGR